MWSYLSFFFSSRRRHTRCLSDWSSDVCSSDLIRDLEELRRRISGPKAAGAEGVRKREDLGNAASVMAKSTEVGERLTRFRSEERRVGKECRSRWAGE